MPTTRFPMTLTLLVAGAITLSCGAGCGSRNADPVGNAPTASLDRTSFLPGLARVFCEALQPCCSAVGLSHDATACTAEATIVLGWRYPATASANATFDSDAAAACLRGYATYVGRCAGPSYWDVRWNEDLDPVLAPCGVVLKGTRGLGEPCSNWQDCIQDAPGPVDCDGSCTPRSSLRPVVPPTPVRAGQACTVEFNLEICADPCEPGTFCDGGICTAQHASGPCVDVCHQACTTESYCNAGTCAPKPNLPTGAACTTGPQCGGPKANCIRSSICAPELLYACAH